MPSLSLGDVVAGASGSERNPFLFLVVGQPQFLPGDRSRFSDAWRADVFELTTGSRMLMTFSCDLWTRVGGSSLPALDG